MVLIKKKITIFILFIFTFLVIYLFRKQVHQRNQIIDFENYMKNEDSYEKNIETCEAYRSKCFSLYKKLRYPDEKYKFSIPVQEIPQELYDNFTQHGYMPLTKKWYFNDAYSDSFSADKNKTNPVDIAIFDLYRDKVRKWQPLGYDDLSFHVTMDKYKKDITSKSIVI